MNHWPKVVLSFYLLFFSATPQYHTFPLQGLLDMVGFKWQLTIFSSYVLYFHSVVTLFFSLISLNISVLLPPLSYFLLFSLCFLTPYWRHFLRRIFSDQETWLFRRLLVSFPLYSGSRILIPHLIHRSQFGNFFQTHPSKLSIYIINFRESHTLYKFLL